MMNPAGATTSEPVDSRRVGWAAIALVVIVLVSRWPFLEAGYGSNIDAWRVAWTARHIAASGEYVVSRFPGYPLHEYACALVARGGPTALNGLSAVASALAALFFYWYLRLVRSPVAWLSALTLAFVPVVFVNSTSAKDYLAALACLIAALVAAGKRRAILAGILLGAATGFRPASIVLGLPLVLILIKDDDDFRGQLRLFARFAVASCVMALGAFAPVMLRYGWSFVRAYPHEEPWSNALRNATTGSLGALGCVGLLVAIAAAIAVRGRGREPRVTRNQIIAWASGVIVVGAVFAAIPHQAGYLIPAFPFLILLLGQFAPRWAVLTFCGLTILSSFVDFDRGGLKSGAIFTDRALRLEQMAATEAFVVESAKFPGAVVFVVGGRHALVSVLHPELVGSGEHQFAYLLGRHEAEDLVRRGYRIVCSEDVRQANILFREVDLAEFGAVVYDAKP